MEEKDKDTSEIIVSISNNEDVTRTIHPEWMVRGQLQLSAFALQPGETYISVNRPIIPTYNDDIKDFILSHPSFIVEGGHYHLARMNVGKIRAIEITIGSSTLVADVDVEARAMHTESHAGIFTRFEGKNIKTGQIIKVEKQEKGVSSDDVLMDLRFSLLSMATMETQTTTKPEKK